MSRVAWSVFYPLVLSQVPLCPKPMVTKAIRDSAIEFCEKTHVWKDVQSIAIGAGADYEFERDAVSSVWRIDQAEVVGQRELEIHSPERCDELYPGWRSGEVTGPPDTLTQLSPEYFTLVPAPIDDAVLTLSVTLKPAKASAYTEAFLYNDYEEAIASGALARLMGMPGKPWTRAEAGTFAAIFNDKVNNLNLRVAKAFGRAPIRVRGQFM